MDRTTPEAYVEMGGKDIILIQKTVCLLNQNYIYRFHARKEPRARDLQGIYQFLEKRYRLDGTVFVHWRGKRKS